MFTLFLIIAAVHASASGTPATNDSEAEASASNKRQRSSEELNTCSVCLEPVESNETGNSRLEECQASLRCIHGPNFHESCLRAALSNCGLRCPYCRQTADAVPSRNLNDLARPETPESLELSLPGLESAGRPTVHLAFAGPAWLFRRPSAPGYAAEEPEARRALRRRRLVSN